AVAAANIAYQEETGKNIGQTVIAGLTGGNNSAAQTSAPQTMVAQNLTALSPAAVGGQASANNIIWSKAPAQVASLQPVFSQSVSLLSPPSTTPGTIGEGPVSPSTAPPALQPKGAASTIVLHTQEAPAGKARKAMPPELIAQKMMEGLQKYAAMKQQSLAPTLSASY
ncbi:MAG: hypothetical protein KGL10_05025, partial [Alphaproteobacteria bacterium]|nr:hypothetical protein [Alphaproteobacteria bacterium]